MTTTTYSYQYEGNNNSIQICSIGTVTGFKNGIQVFYREVGQWEMFNYENSLISKLHGQNVPHKITTVKEEEVKL